MKKLLPWISAVLVVAALAPAAAFADESLAEGEPEATPAAVVESGAQVPAEAAPAPVAESTEPDFQEAPASPQEPASLEDAASAPATEPDSAPAGNSLETPASPEEESLASEQSEPDQAVDEEATPANEAEPQQALAAAPKALATAPKLAATKAVAPKAAVDPSPTIVKTAVLADKAVYQISSLVSDASAVLVIDIPTHSAAAGRNVLLGSNQDFLRQYWQAIHRGNGVYRFINLAGTVMLASSSSPKSGVNIVLGRSAELDWRLAKYSDGSYAIMPASNTKLHLAVVGSSPKSGSNIALINAGNALTERFTFTLSKTLTEAVSSGRAVTGSVVEIAVASKPIVRLDIANASKANNAIVETTISYTPSERFVFFGKGNNLYAIRNVNSGRYLSPLGNSTKVGAALVQNLYRGGINELWYLVKKGSGFQIKSAKTGYVVDLKGSVAQAKVTAQVSKPSNAITQVYRLTNPQIIANGTYVIQSALAMPMVLDITGCSKADGANVEIYRSNGSVAQQFRITFLGNERYRISNPHSGKFIDTARSSTANGGNIIQYKNTGNSSQIWKIEKGKYGYMFKSYSSNKYLDVSGGEVRSGTNVIQWTKNGGKNQNWVLRPASWSYYKNVSARDMKYIEKAEQYEGWPYEWGGRSPSTSFDCAGLVMYCANQVWGTKFDLMYTNAEILYSKCKPISEKEARPGDLVFYRGTYGSNVNYISHVVIYTGNGWMYGAGDPIGYSLVNSITNIYGKQATKLYARIYH